MRPRKPSRGSAWWLRRLLFRIGRHVEQHNSAVVIVVTPLELIYAVWSLLRLRRAARDPPHVGRSLFPWIASQSALVFAQILLTGACVPIGSAALPSDQIAYADAIGDANKRLALSNIVKLRYGDTPTFLATS
jgi:hypothetical protein